MVVVIDIDKLDSFILCIFSEREGHGNALVNSEGDVSPLD